MAYLVPSEFVTKMVDAGESKVFMSTRDTVIRAYMAGAILALAAAFAVTVPADRADVPRALAGIEGVYVPSLYEARYLPDGRLEATVPVDAAGLPAGTSHPERGEGGMPLGMAPSLRSG